MTAPKKIRDLDWFEIWQTPTSFDVYSPTSIAGKFSTYRRALEWIADQQDDQDARHKANYLLAELLA